MQDDPRIHGLKCTEQKLARFLNVGLSGRSFHGVLASPVIVDIIGACKKILLFRKVKQFRRLPRSVV